MRKFSLPVMVDFGLNMEMVIAEINKVKPDRVFLHFNNFSRWKKNEKRTKVLDLITTYRKRLEKEGYETGVWIVTLGYGGDMPQYIHETAKGITRRQGIFGTVRDDGVCPLCENATKALCDYVEDVAKTGTKMIMLDDEYVLSVVPGIACFCDLHMAKYREMLGENIAREELPEKIFTGGKNKYRDAWFNLMRETLCDLSKKLRATVDKVDPAIRMGFCTGFTSWDFECADAIELTYLLAGNTKPFVRTTGAPYWYAAKRFGLQSLQTIAEITRQQLYWCKDHPDIEIFTENDPYPRIRQLVPAAYTELFDQMMIVSENPDTLKYVIDYNNNPDYEPGYVKAHLKNLPLAQQLDKMFHDKKATGIRIFEFMKRIQNEDLPTPFMGERPIMTRWMNQASQIPSANAIPIMYEDGDYCGMAFGENAKYVPLSACDKGLVLDLKGAQTLQARGIDVGLLSASKISDAVVERYCDNGYTPQRHCASDAFAMQVKDNSNVLSYYETDSEKFPASYLYENANGQRFLVYGFNMEDNLAQSGTTVSNARAKQLNEAIPYLCGKKMPVVCHNQPMLYCVCKTNDKAMAAAYFNCHADEKENIEIELNFTPKSMEFVNCTGSFDGNKVTIDYIAAYKMAAFEAEY